MNLQQGKIHRRHSIMAIDTVNATASGARPPLMLLFAEAGPARTAYQKALADAGAGCLLVDSLREMHERLRSNACGGLLVDVPTLIKSTGPEKRLAQGILEHYPVLRLRYDAGNDSIHGLFYGQSEPGGDVVRDFVSLAATTFTPRAMRGEEREEAILNVVIHRVPPEAGATGERAVTVNASSGGCFLYTCSEYEVGETVWLEFVDLSDRTPVRGRLRWRVEWGKSMSLPGIGVAFEAMTPEQANELAGLLGFGGERPQPDDGCAQ